MRRALRRFLLVLGILAALAIVLPVLAIGVANTQWGRAQIVALVASSTAGSANAVAIEGLEGVLPGRIAARRIVVSDPGGEWLTVEQAELVWSPLTLLRGAVRVDSLRALRIAVLRPPAAPAAAASEGGGGAIPDWAASLEVLEIARLELPAALAGRDVAFAVNGRAQWAGGAGGATLRIAALDGLQARYTLDARYGEAGVALAVASDEAGDGPIASRLGLPGAPPVTARARLDGPLSAAQLALDIAAGALRVEASGVLDLPGQAARLRVAAASGRMEPAQGVAWDTMQLAAEISGRFAAPAVDATLDLAGLAAGGAEMEALRLVSRASVEAAGPRLNLSATATRLRVPGPRADLLAAAPLVAEAAIALDGAAVDVQGLRIRHPLFDVSGRGRSEGETVAAEITAAVPSLAPLLAIGHVVGDGRLAIGVAVSGTRAAPLVRLALEGGLASGPEPLATLLGPAARLNAVLEPRPAANRLAIPELTLDAARFGVRLAGMASPEGVTLDWSATLADLAPLAPGLSGAVSAAGRVEGPPGALTTNLRVAAERIARDGMELRALVADLSARGLPAAPEGTLRLAARMGEAPVALAGGFALGPGGAWRATLDEFAFPGIAATGRAEGAGTPRSAELRVSARDLAPLGRLLGVGVRGAAEIVARARPGAGALPDAEIEATLRGAGMPGVEADATVTASFRDGTASLRVAAERVAVAGRRLRVRVEADGPPDALRVSLGVDDPDVELRAAGTVRALGAPSVALASATIRARGETLALQGPARVAMADGIRIEALRLGLRGGTIALDGRVDGAASDLRVTATRLPLALADLAAPGLALEGTADAELRLTGAPASPRGRLRLALRGARMRDAALRLPPADATLDAELLGDAARIQAGLTLGGSGRLQVSGRVPFAPGGAADLRAEGTLDLALANLVLAAQGRRAAGRATVDATIRGPLDRPALAGSLRLADVLFDDPVNGMKVDRIAGTVTLAGAVALLDLRGRMGGGTVALSGSVDGIPAAPSLDLAVALRTARLVDTPTAVMSGDGDITARGRLAEALAVAGTISVRRAEIRVAESLPAALPTLRVREVGRRSPFAPRTATPPPPAPEPAAAAGGPRIALDIAVAMPRAVFVRGRGIEAEMGGALRVRGTAAAPDIDGRIAMRRGDFTLAGQRLNFSRGAVTFDGAPGMDPLLDFEARTAAGTATGIVRIGGRASAPTIELASDSGLPQDEVLSHILFGRASARLSPLELATLAQAVAELSGRGGGGPGLLGRLRQGLGLDRLQVDTGASGQVGVEAGRYVADGVYVGVRSGRDPGESRGVVQIEVLPRVRIEAEAGTAGRVGVTYELDY